MKSLQTMGNQLLCLYTFSEWGYEFISTHIVMLSDKLALELYCLNSLPLQLLFCWLQLSSKVVDQMLKLGGEDDGA